MLMTHLLLAVFKRVVMLSQGSIHFRQELINLISYVKRGGDSRNPSSFCQPLFRRQQLSYNSRQSTRRDNNSHI